MGGFNLTNFDNLVGDNSSPSVAGEAQAQQNLNGIVQGGGQAQPQLAAQQPKGMVKRSLANFFYGFGQASLRHAGLPTDIDLQNHQMQMAATGAQIQQTRAATQNTLMQGQMLQRRIQALQQMTQGGDPYASLGPLSADEQALADIGRQQATIEGDPKAIHQAIEKIVQARNTKSLFAGTNLTTDANGNPIKQIINKGGQVTGQLATTPPASLAENENNWIAKANAGDPIAKQKLADLQNRRIQIAGARGAAYAQAKADNTPFPVFDADGNLTTVPASTAIRQGYPSAQVWASILGPTSSTKSQGQAAGAVADHIPAFQKAVQNLAAKGQLGAVTGRLNTYLTQGYGGNDPDIAEFITTAGLIKTGAVRAHFGARGGAQVLGTFDKYLNTAQEPQALIGSSNALNSFLSTYKNVGTPKGPGRGPAPQGGSQPTHVWTPGGLKPVVK